MNTTSIENIPQIWNDQDEQFFRITAALFSPDFCNGAGVLLASYDDVDSQIPVGDDSTSAVASAVTPATATTHATSG